MQLTLLVITVAALINVVASVTVLRVPVFSPSQRLFQVGLIWLVPIIGAVVCVVFSSSQALDATSLSTVDPLHLTVAIRMAPVSESADAVAVMGAMTLGLGSSVAA
jgi:hypothetical protein